MMKSNMSQVTNTEIIFSNVRFHLTTKKQITDR